MKGEKKKAKEEMTITANCLMEKIDTAIGVVSEYETLGSGIKVEVPEYEAPKSIVEEEVVPETVAATKSEDKYVEVDKHDDYKMESEQNLEPKLEVEQISYKEVVEIIPKKENLPDNYEGYSILSVTDKIKRYVFQNSDDVFTRVEKYFKQIGYKTSFNELYEEAAVLEKALNSYKINFMVENVVRKMLDAGITADNYSRVSVSAKAKCMDWDSDNNSFNLYVYMKLMDKLGAKMSQMEMYEDYQGIYDEKIKLDNDRIPENKKQNKSR